MADDDDKTEEPTSKKISDARSEGNVGKSAEIVGATTILFGTIYLLFYSSHMFKTIQDLMKYSFSFIKEDLSPEVYASLYYTFVRTGITVLLPFFMLVVFLALAANWAQFGMLLNPLKMDFAKLDPIKGLKSLFALKKILEASKLTAKLTLIVFVNILLLSLTGEMFLEMMDKELSASMDTMILLITYFLAAIIFIILLFAIIDFYFTKHYYIKSLKMSKQEIKDEHKNMEGNPEVKARIRRIQMKMAMERMMSNVPDADVVITNPSHYAVAMKYDNEVSNAPKIVAKGIDFIAIKIKDLARENDIPIIENPALARALYDQLEVEQVIPEEFYKAIAEIFSYVFELKKG